MDSNIYIAPIEQDARPRRERETAAVETLVAAAFGPDAHKYNLPSGAPEVRFSGPRAGMHAPVFSISHSRDYAVLVVSPDGRPIGVDIESFRPTLRRVVPKFLSADEAAAYATDERLLLAWTLKEASYKAAGITGLSLLDIWLPLDGGGDIITLPGGHLRILRTIATAAYTLSIVAAIN